MKRLQQFVIVLAIAAGVFALICRLTIPSKTDLVYTSSTHENLHFLKVDSPSLSDGYRVSFAVYDSESATLQFTISAPTNRDDDGLPSPDLFQFFVDEEQIQVGNFAIHSSVWRDYYIYLFDNMQMPLLAEITYKNNTARIFQ